MHSRSTSSQRPHLYLPTLPLPQLSNTAEDIRRGLKENVAKVGGACTGRQIEQGGWGCLLPLCHSWLALPVLLLLAGARFYGPQNMLPSSPTAPSPPFP